MSGPRESAVERRYRPLRDYALIGDMRTAALVAKDGSIDWFCTPRFDAPAVFCRLLDAERGGSFRVGPAGAHEVERHYEEDTNVLVTTFRAGSGRLRLTDFMPAGGAAGVALPRILRCVEGLSGTVEIEVLFRPTFDFAQAKTELEPHRGGARARPTEGRERLSLACPVDLAPDGRGGLFGRRLVSAGDRLWIALAHEQDGDDVGPNDLAADAESALEQTLAFWRGWAAACTYEGPYASLVRRSGLVLKLLTYAPTGAIIAAPTTSLPEEAGGVRNWDYRYTWLRDAAWIFDALMRIGQHGGAMEFWKWLERVARRDGPHLRILYGIDGEVPRAERHLEHLEGYLGSAPVRVGNGAAEQTQLDVYGDVLDAVHFCVSQMPEMLPLEGGMWKLIEQLADAAAERWREPDHGLWEARSGKRHYLSSKLMCWVALDRAIRLARLCEVRTPAVSRWEGECSAVRNEILRRGYDPGLGAFTQSLGAPALDASALLIPLVDFLPASDPRVRSTAAKIAEELVKDGLVYRYRLDRPGSDDGLPGGEAAFTLCSFWLAEALALDGRTDEARALFERVTGFASDLGLLSEEIDPAGGELVGNYPQGFTHLGLIRPALRIAEAEDARAGRQTRK